MVLFDKHDIQDLVQQSSKALCQLLYPNLLACSAAINCNEPYVNDSALCAQHMALLYIRKA